MDRRALTWALALAAACASPEDEAVVEPAPAERPIHERIDLPSVAACGGCHVEVFREWSQSLHARAWTNANVRAATDDFAKESCRPCHSPRSIFETGLTRRPAYRDFNQPDGVHCLACHGLEDGVAAARTIEDAPCRPRYEPRLLSADHCYPCHEPTHHAFAEYEESHAFALGIRCVDCHMQPTAHRRGRSHGPNGGQNAAFVARGLACEAQVDGRTAVLTLRNRAGHRFPGEIPSRSLLIEVSFDAPADARPATLVLRKPFRGEERDDNRLRPDEVRTLRFDAPDGARTAYVQVLFRPLPLLPAEACFELFRVELALA
ncbi:MAG: multiheme c-type cytochrome [Planctomycetota bacterium]